MVFALAGDSTITSDFVIKRANYTKLDGNSKEK
jgi:hypothetical protein